jgi:hypothetical protein
VVWWWNGIDVKGAVAFQQGPRMVGKVRLCHAVGTETGISQETLKFFCGVLSIGKPMQLSRTRRFAELTYPVL